MSAAVVDASVWVSWLMSLDSNLAQTAARLAADHALRGADSVYVALALELGLPLLTLDQEQLTRTGNIISASRP